MQRLTPLSLPCFLHRRTAGKHQLCLVYRDPLLRICNIVNDPLLPQSAIRTSPEQNHSPAVWQSPVEVLPVVYADAAKIHFFQGRFLKTSTSSVGIFRPSGQKYSRMVAVALTSICWPCGVLVFTFTCAGRLYTRASWSAGSASGLVLSSIRISAKPRVVSAGAVVLATCARSTAAEKISRIKRICFCMLVVSDEKKKRRRSFAAP